MAYRSLKVEEKGIIIINNANTIFAKLAH